MCGRSTLQLSPELLAEIFGVTEVPQLTPRFNIASFQQVLVVRQDSEYHIDKSRSVIEPI